MKITDLPGWAAAEVAQLLAGPLNDDATEAAIRAVLRLVEDHLVRRGTTSALLARELVARRPKV